MLIYLFTHVNLRLRPKFLDEMKPGSRLVSNTFDMGDWKPDRSARVGSRQIFLWVIPANVTGTWKWTDPASGGGVCTLVVDQRYQHIRGTLSQGPEKTVLTEARVAGDRIAFTIETEAGGVKARREFTGIVEGDRIDGTIVASQGAQAQSARWRAVRDPATKRPIETGLQESSLGGSSRKGRGLPAARGDALPEALTGSPDRRPVPFRSFSGTPVACPSGSGTASASPPVPSTRTRERPWTSNSSTPSWPGRLKS